MVSIWLENMLGHLSLDIICSSMLTVFLELRSRKAVRFSEEIVSAEKYPCIFSREMETIVYILQIYGKSCDSVLWYHVSKRYLDYPKKFS